jgi:glycosyltransferase involved in cell wall biosynthesis
LLAFLRWLRENSDCDFGILLRSPGPLEAELRQLGPTVTLGTSLLSRTRLGRRLRGYLPRSLQTERRKIQGMFAAGSYDLIYANTMTNGAILEALASTGVPVITHVHELDYWIWRSGAENLRQVLAHTTDFIAVSQAVRENLIRHHGVPESKITVIYEHIRELPPVPSAEEKASARQALGIPDGAFVVGGCGAEHWRKGRDLIPQLRGALQRQGPARNVHFVWIGRPGTAEEEYALAHDLRAAGVETCFHASGEVDNPFQLFPALDVFALLSREDPYPLACLEVAATEIPVVCFENAGGMPEFVRDGCGLVAPYLDVERMAQDVLHLAADPELSRTFGRRARAKVGKGNLLGTTAPQLLGVMEKLLGGKGPRALRLKEADGPDQMPGSSTKPSQPKGTMASAVTS